MRRKRMYMLLFAVVLTGMMLWCPPVYATVSAPVFATDLTAETVFTADVGAATIGNLKDNTLKTKWKHSGKATITLLAPESIYALYVVSDTPLETWQLTSEQETQSCGEGGFIHDYISINKPSNEITITLDNEKISLCDITVFSQGKAPDWVEKWNSPYEKADMLVISTHADDEHLWFGGTLPTYAGERQYRVQVAYLTHHWKEWVRPHEMLKGLWTVGVRAYPLISEFPDQFAKTLAQAEKKYNRDEIVQYEVMLIRRFKPEVIMAQDLHGEYGHGMHILGAQVACKAAEISADADQYPQIAQRFGTWDPPKLYLHLYDKNTLVMDWDQPLQTFGGKTGFEMAKLGFACHKSQVQDFSVSKSGKYDCRKFGLYRSLVGEDIHKDDFFENIKKQEIAVSSAPPASVSPSNPSSMLTEGSSAESKTDAPPTAALWPLIGIPIVAAILLVWLFKVRQQKRS